MRIFRHWIRHSSRLTLPDGTLEVSCWGGSDTSPDAARRDAEQRLDAVRRRVIGSPPTEAYEADIREELIERLDRANAVTRTRYGALVLNSTDHVFIDIDEPRHRFWQAFLPRPNLAKRKQRIIEQVRERARKTDCVRLGLRVYETHKGIRVLVQGLRLDPASPAATEFLQSFNADWMYAALCRKQACWRARLTPKPHRMKLRAHRVRWPRDAEQQAAFESWLPGYEAASAGYATCRFVEALGISRSSPIIDFHDATTEATSGRPLA